MIENYSVRIMHANGEMKKILSTQLVIDAIEVRNSYIAKGFLVEIWTADTPLPDEVLHDLTNTAVEQ